MIASIADRVKAVLNTANSASLPLTFDQSRPEFSLLVNENTTPAADTIFSQLLQVGTDKPTPDSDSALLTRLLPLAAAIADDVATPMSVGQPLLDKTDATVAVLQRSLHLPVVMSEAGRQLGERLALMVRGDIQQATIRLDPPELGLMDVRITVQNDQTQVQIVVQSPQVREALESQSVRLREFLEQQGLSLAQLDIRDQSAGQQQAGTGEHDEGSDEASSGLANENNQKEVDEAVSWQQGLVDHFV
jgi:flagellar hook-length control protein FliK